MTVFAFDAGNGYVKAKSPRATYVALSMLAKERSLGDSSIASSIEKQGYQTYQSPLDNNIPYVWGEDITDIVSAYKLLSTYTYHDRYANKHFKLLIEFVLAELASDYDEDVVEEVTVVTGMPSREIKTPAENTLRHFLLGKHVVTRNGIEKTIHVNEVRILEQPLGTLLSLYMTDDGQIHQDLETSTFSIIDFGSGTTILDTFKNLKRLEDQSETYYRGMNALFTDILTRIRRHTNITQVQEIHVEKGIYNNYTIDVSAREKIPFQCEAKEAIRDFVDQLMTQINSTLTSRDHVDKFILTGGGSEIIGPRFTEVFNEEGLYVLENSQLSNVEGYFRLGSAITKG